MDIVELIKGKIAYESEIGITIHYMHRQELEGICDEIERLRDDLKHSDEVRQSALQSLLAAENEIERLREALTLIAMTKNDDIRPSHEIIKMIWLGCTQIARAALKEGE